MSPSTPAGGSERGTGNGEIGTGTGWTNDTSYLDPIGCCSYGNDPSCQSCQKPEEVLTCSYCMQLEDDCREHYPSIQTVPYPGLGKLPYFYEDNPCSLLPCGWPHPLQTPQNYYSIFWKYLLPSRGPRALIWSRCAVCRAGSIQTSITGHCQSPASVDWRSTWQPS